MIFDSGIEKFDFVKRKKPVSKRAFYFVIEAGVLKHTLNMYIVLT